MGVIPIINENDTVATEEIVFGDNDTLAAHAATSIGGDLLIILSDVDGLYTADPKKDEDAKIITSVFKLTDEIMALGGDAGSALGTGGMCTKLKAAKIATEGGCDMLIINGNDPDNLYRALDGELIGTEFHAKR